MFATYADGNTTLPLVFPKTESNPELLLKTFPKTSCARFVA